MHRLDDRAADALLRELLRAYYTAVLTARPGKLQLDDELRARLDGKPARSSQGGGLAALRERIAWRSGARCNACTMCATFDASSPRTCTLRFVDDAALAALHVDAVPLLVLLGCCSSPAVPGLMLGQGDDGAPIVEAPTAKLVRMMLHDARPLAGDNGQLIVVCHKSASPLWHCSRLEAMHCARGGVVTQQACLRPCAQSYEPCVRSIPGQALGNAAAAVAVGARPHTTSKTAAAAIDSALLRALRAAPTCGPVALYEFPGRRDLNTWLLELTGLVKRGASVFTELSTRGGCGFMAVWEAAQVEFGGRGSDGGHAREDTGSGPPVVVVHAPHLMFAHRSEDATVFARMRRKLQLLGEAARALRAQENVESPTADTLPGLLAGWAQRIDGAHGGTQHTPTAASSAAASSAAAGAGGASDLTARDTPQVCALQRPSAPHRLPETCGLLLARCTRARACGQGRTPLMHTKPPCASSVHRRARSRAPRRVSAHKRRRSPVEVAGTPGEQVRVHHRSERVREVAGSSRAAQPVPCEAALAQLTVPSAWRGDPMGTESAGQLAASHLTSP